MRPTLVFLLSIVIAGAAVIDRLAVTVGNQAITESEIANDIRLAALLNGSTIDNSLAARRAAAGRLIEQALVRREMSFGSYPLTPEARVDEEMARVEKEKGGALALRQILAGSSLTEKDLRAYLKWQLQFLRFIDLRFRPAVQVTNEDVEKYYQQNLASAKAENSPSLVDVRTQIEQKLTGERVDEQLDRWIKQSRAHTIIRFEDPQLAEVAASPAPNGIESHR